MKIWKFILFFFFPYLLVLLVGVSINQMELLYGEPMRIMFLVSGGSIALIFAVFKMFEKPIPMIISILVFVFDTIIYRFDIVTELYFLIMMIVVYIYFKIVGRVLRDRKVKIMKYFVFAIFLTIAVIFKGAVSAFIFRIGFSIAISNIKLEIFYAMILGFVLALGFDIADLLEKKYIGGA